MLKNQSKSELISEIKSKNLPVIIYGAATVGEVLFQLCEREGIAVSYFCDGNEKTAQRGCCGKQVIHTPTLKDKINDAVFILSVVAVKDAVDILNNFGFDNWCAGGLLLKDFDISQDNSDYTLDYTRFAVENAILCHDGFLNQDKLFLRSIDLIITERCSLKCRDCSNLMQYYEHPQNCSLPSLFRAVDIFFEIIDEVMDFRVLGGEPFIDPDWPVIVKRLVNEPKARRIVIYTNGTIIPRADDMEVLKNKKVLVTISDYGKLSHNLEKLKEIFSKSGITYYILPVDSWLDCSSITPHNRGDVANREVFRLCCGKNMFTLSDGRIYRCPYAANAARLRAVPGIKDDYIDLFALTSEGRSVAEIKLLLKEYLLNKDFLTICDYCKGRPLYAPEIVPNIQTREPLPYQKYD